MKVQKVNSVYNMQNQTKRDNRGKNQKKDSGKDFDKEKQSSVFKDILDMKNNNFKGY